ncbi:DUF1524 domain-containing protein [Xylanimonas protaetiae]|uniref:DUF1524 domain-containing protein n=2 Tax=Xylanimonas protaetiae TaxID=2509457 RepID=A0A4V0YGN9_9MICO|nr:DUF1524 domain-containing protein [Xylanimonas protaetiae]
MVFAGASSALASDGEAAGAQPSTTPIAASSTLSATGTSPTPTASRTPMHTSSPSPSVDPEGAERGTALAAVAMLTFKGRAPMTGYEREEFGPAWTDVDHNGCDTRNDILKRDLVDESFKAGTQGCVVLAGTFADPYSGETIEFERGEKSSLVQIDHVVALADAWQKGAQQWDATKREAFANDPLNLLASDGSLNQSKGAGDAATWLPPNKAFRCRYVARQVAVKAHYGLWVTTAERDAMIRVLSGCPDEPLPDGVKVSTTSSSGSSSGSGTIAAPPVTVPDHNSSTEPEAPVYYANCSDVRAAGAAPLYSGDPGYRLAMDRDKDGIACE